jgi:hypothetical protein
MFVQLKIELKDEIAELNDTIQHKLKTTLIPAYALKRYDVPANSYLERVCVLIVRKFSNLF